MAFPTKMLPGRLLSVALMSMTLLLCKWKNDSESEAKRSDLCFLHFASSSFLRIYSK